MPLADRPQRGLDSTVSRRPDQRPWGSWLLGSAALIALPVACKLEPKTPVIHHTLSPLTTGVDADTGEALIPPSIQEHIRGSLEMLFGSPAHPRYMMTAEWADEGFDPGYPTYAVGDEGSGELTGEAFEPLRAGNLQLFSRQLAAIARGAWAAVEVPDTAPDLRADWIQLLRDTPADQRGEEFREQAAALFRDWYPSLRESSELYRVQCLHCHGPSGGGDGPTSRFLDPRPRDYRLGVFKFTAVKDKARPRRADLYRILDEGVTGTAMPSFRRLAPAELHGLVDYVRLLSIRGEVERGLAQTALDEAPVTVGTVLETYTDVWERWKKGMGDDYLIVVDGDVPAPSPASIARGRELFMDAKTGNCFSCHGESGLGDGVAAWTVVEGGEKVPAYKDDWGHPILPRNLNRGVFRGGRRPIDLYRRVYAGINGTPMPALGETKDAEGKLMLDKDDLWALVHYVGTLAERPLSTPAGTDAGHH